jgi:hypothetical protein
MQIKQSQHGRLAKCLGNPYLQSLWSRRYDVKGLHSDIWLAATVAASRFSINLFATEIEAISAGGAASIAPRKLF